jgi:hypothetical protein
MGGSCSTHGGNAKCIQSLVVQNMKIRDHFGRQSNRWENIKINLKKIWNNDTDWN